MSLPLLEKISFLKNKYVNNTDLSVIEGWEKELENAILGSSLSEHQSVKDLVISWQTDIGGMEGVLSTDRSLTQDERLRIMDKRDVINRFIKTITGSDEKIKHLEKLVDEAVEHYNKNYQK